MLLVGEAMALWELSLEEMEWLAEEETEWLAGEGMVLALAWAEERTAPWDDDSSSDWSSAPQAAWDEKPLRVEEREALVLGLLAHSLEALLEALLEAVQAPPSLQASAPSLTLLPPFLPHPRSHHLHSYQAHPQSHLH